MSLRWMLDTNIVSDLVQHPMGAVFRHLERRGAETACISIVTSAEVRFGVAKRQSTKLVREVEGLLLRMRILPFEAGADVEYARIRSELGRRGTPIGPVDYFIAAHALALDLTLVTANIGEFARVPGLRVENWLD